MAHYIQWNNNTINNWLLIKNNWREGSGMTYSAERKKNPSTQNFTCSKYRGGRKTFLDKYTLRNV